MRPPSLIENYYTNNRYFVNTLRRLKQARRPGCYRPLTTNFGNPEPVNVGYYFIRFAHLANAANRHRGEWLIELGKDVVLQRIAYDYRSFRAAEAALEASDSNPSIVTCVIR